MIRYRIEESINLPVGEVLPYLADPTLHPRCGEAAELGHLEALLERPA